MIGLQVPDYKIFGCVYKTTSKFTTHVGAQIWLNS